MPFGAGVIFLYEPAYLITKRQVMTMENKRKRFLNAASVLSPPLYKVLSTTPDSIAGKVQEITLRLNRPLCVECSGRRYYFTENNCLTDSILDTKMVQVSERSMFETFHNICNYSVYSRQNEINNGYITLKGGHRAGVCGTAVISDNKIVNIKDITSINIRIAREILGCSKELLSSIDAKKGVLICGAPCSGKTTIIRDIARHLSYECKVSVIDERNELSSNVGGVFQNDMGMCDVFDSYIKSDAIVQAVRSMAPDVIVCDEISTQKDVDALTYGLNSGVSFIVTLHAGNVQELLNRPLAQSLLKSGAISTVVFLSSRNEAGQIKSIVPIEEILGDTYV